MMSTRTPLACGTIRRTPTAFVVEVVSFINDTLVIRAGINARVERALDEAFATDVSSTTPNTTN